MVEKFRSWQRPVRPTGDARPLNPQCVRRGRSFQTGVVIGSVENNGMRRFESGRATREVGA